MAHDTELEFVLHTLQPLVRISAKKRISSDVAELINRLRVDSESLVCRVE